MSGIPKPPAPIVPATRSPFALDAQVDAATSPPAPTVPANNRPAPSTSPTPPAGGRVIRRIMLELDDPQKARLEATQLHTAGHTGLRTQQAFIRHAISRLCDEMEARYNSGEPFDPPGST